MYADRTTYIVQYNFSYSFHFCQFSYACASLQNLCNTYLLSHCGYSVYQCMHWSPSFRQIRLLCDNIATYMKRALCLGLLSYLWKSMVLLTTRVFFEMLFSCIMGGSYLGYLYIVFVSRVSPLIMLWIVQLHRAYPTLRHNELCDFTIEILSEVCADVCIEPQLQPLSWLIICHCKYAQL